MNREKPQAASNPPEHLVLGEGKFLRLVKSGRWEYAERINVSGAVAVAAVTPERKFLLVEQYRIPCGKAVIELPAGIAGDSLDTANEPLVEAARRELREETGYEAAHLEAILTGPTSAGLTSELVTLFAATDLRRVGPGGGEGGEEIIIHEIPLAQAEEWLLQQGKQGKLVDHKVFAGLYFVKKLQDSLSVRVRHP